MDSLPNEPVLISGGFAVDDRGQLSFANEFDFAGIKRFYLVENFSTDVVRAFHGHLKEAKFVFPAVGTAIVAAVRMTPDANPDTTARPFRFVISDRMPRLLYIPPGYANGFRPLEPGTKLLFFSTVTVSESKGDDYRFPYDQWGADLWVTENR